MECASTGVELNVTAKRLTQRGGECREIVLRGIGAMDGFHGDIPWLPSYSTAKRFASSCRKSRPCPG